MGIEVAVRRVDHQPRQRLDEEQRQQNDVRNQSGSWLYDRAVLESLKASRWTRHLFYRAEHTRTTWKLRLGLLALVVVTLWLTSGWWTAALARGLVCNASLAPSDAILVENFDPDYLLFERANRLRAAGLAARVLVPIQANPGTQEPNDVALGTAEVMARIAQTGTIEVVPVREVEPITLNAARDIRRFLEREHIRTVIVVTPLFRSRRSALVYDAILGRAGIVVRYEPVQGSRGVNDWPLSWHGIQEVVEQWLKLQYYRLYVLPFVRVP
jgi:hypothetical protein